MNPSLLENCRKISYEWKKYYVSQLPDYAYKNEDGMRFVSLRHMDPITKRVKDIYIQALERMGDYPLPPIAN